MNPALQPGSRAVGSGMAVCTTLDALNALPPDAFGHALDGVFEHAPWVAAAVAAQRPFATVAALHDALMGAVRGAPDAQQAAFLNNHPELQAGTLPTSLTPESHAEQAGAALADAALPELNRAYRARHGIPFITCVRRHTAANVLRELHRRMGHMPEAERAAALDEVGHITRLRLMDRVDGPGPPETNGRLSTHVLDTAAGCPAAGLAVSLSQEGVLLGSWRTDKDGRMARPLLSGAPLRQGRYELLFEAGAYFEGRGVPSFHGTIPVRFNVTESEAHYHIPLLLAPYSYTTYRGS